MFAVGADAADSTITQYVTARTGGGGMNGAEMSPWNGMGACTGAGASEMFVNLGVGNDPGPGVPGAACQVSLVPITPNTIAVIASSNGPGGSDSANTELMSRIVVAAE